MCFDGNGTSGCMGGTAIAAKSLGLNEEQTLDAFGIALSMCGGTMYNTNGFWTFKLPNALSAFHGIWAAEMAKSGYKGLDDPLTGPQCFFDMFALEPDTSKLSEKLGEIYYSDMVIKPWSGCRGTHVPLDAAKKALNGRVLKADEVKSIKVGGPASVTGFVGREFPFGTTSETDALFSIRYSLAHFILNGSVSPASYCKEAMLDPSIKDLQDKMEIYRWDPQPGKEGAGGMAAKVEIELQNGEILADEVIGTVFGDCELSPMTEDELFEKFDRNVKTRTDIDYEKYYQAYECVKSIEEVDDMCELIKYL